MDRIVLIVCILLCSACVSSQRISLPVCPDDLRVAERDLSADEPFNPRKAVYRQGDGSLCSGV